MNKILREEMEYLITCDDKAFTPDVKDDVKMTLDYIDELEKENEQLKKCNKESITFLNQDDIRDVLIRKDHNIFYLQDRINKAIEYIEKNNIYVENDTLRTGKWELLDILRGEDEERNNRNTIKKSNL